MSGLLRGSSQEKRREGGRMMRKGPSKEVLKSSLGLIGANHTDRVVPLGSREPVSHLCCCSHAGGSVKGIFGESAGCELLLEPLQQLGGGVGAPPGTEAVGGMSPPMVITFVFTSYMPATKFST